MLERTEPQKAPLSNPRWQFNFTLHVAVVSGYVHIDSLCVKMIAKYDTH